MIGYMWILAVCWDKGGVKMLDLWTFLARRAGVQEKSGGVDALGLLPSGSSKGLRWSS